MGKSTKIISQTSKLCALDFLCTLNVIPVSLHASLGRR